MKPELPFCEEHRTYFWREKSIRDHRLFAHCKGPFPKKQYDTDVPEAYVKARRVA